MKIKQLIIDIATSHNIYAVDNRLLPVELPTTFKNYSQSVLIQLSNLNSMVDAHYRGAQSFPSSILLRPLPSTAAHHQEIMNQRDLSFVPYSIVNVGELYQNRIGIEKWNVKSKREDSLWKEWSKLNFDSSGTLSEAFDRVLNAEENFAIAVSLFLLYWLLYRLIMIFIFRIFLQMEPLSEE